MIDSIFNTLYEALMSSAWIAVAASLGWGILSILLSPCHLSSIPLIVGFITSRGKMSAAGTFYVSLVFSLGILVTIAAVGVITASLGRLMGDLGSTGNYFVAGIFFLVGVYLLGIINIDWNPAGLRRTNSGGLVAALILGLLFGLALGPCTFAYMAPVLAVVFQVAQTNFYYSIILLAAFGTGHCAVIVSAGMLTGKIQKYLDWSDDSKVILWIKRICGVLVILGGIYLVYIVN